MEKNLYSDSEQGKIAAARPGLRPAFSARVSEAMGGLGTGHLLAILAASAVLALVLALSPKIFLAIVLTLFVIVMTLISPFAGLLIVLSFIFLRPAERFPALSALHFARAQAVLTIGIWLLYRHLRRKSGLVHHSIATTFAAGALVIGISAATALWRNPAFLLLADYLFSLLILVATVDLLDSESRLRGYVVVLLLVATWLSVEQLLGYGTTRFTKGVVRSGGLGTALGDTNEFALAMLFFLPFAFYTALSASNRAARWGAGGLSLLLVASIVATGSRGAVIGFLALVIALWAKSRHKLLVGLGLVALLVAIWCFSSPSYKQRVASILTYQQEITATVRREAWKAGMRMFIKRPLFGVGANNFPVAYDTAGFGSPSGGKWVAAHSVYVQTLAELGILGFAWLVGLIALIFSATHKAQHRLQERAPPRGFFWIAANAAPVSLITYLAAGAFLSCLYYPYLWILGGLAIVLEIGTRGLVVSQEIPAQAAQVEQHGPPMLPAPRVG